LNVNLNGIQLKDQFQWDTNNEDNDPEIFARTLCADLGLSREFEVAVALSIREQLTMYKLAALEGKSDFLKFKTVDNAIRKEEELIDWTPTLELGKEIKDREIRYNRRGLQPITTPTPITTDSKENLLSLDKKKSYRFESRHNNAVRRPRGPGGKFLSKEELDDLQRKGLWNPDEL